jgi:VanZ family protein
VPKKLWLIIAICYTIILTIYSLINIDSLPELGTDYDDKIIHVLAYGLLNLLWYFTLQKVKVTKPVFIAALLSIIYGIILEVLQGQLTYARSLDMLDVLANSIGVVIVSVFIIIRNKTRVKNL